MIKVGSETNHYKIQCFSTHLTTFAGGFLVLPAPINWNYVFANADFAKNKTIYLTVICSYILYLLIILYARYKDKKDLEKLGVTPLPDNYTADQYFYQLLVFTGYRKDAGTNSKVRLEKKDPSVFKSLNRFILFLRVRKMKHRFGRSLILIEKFYNVVESMLLLWRFQSKEFLYLL